jgi:hypothetical protein
MPRNSVGLICWLLSVLALVVIGLLPEEPSLRYLNSVPGRIVDIASDQSTVRIALIAKADSSKPSKTSQPLTKLFSVSATQKDLRATLKLLHRGDLVAIG